MGPNCHEGPKLGLPPLYNALRARFRRVWGHIVPLLAMMDQLGPKFGDMMVIGRVYSSIGCVRPPADRSPSKKIKHLGGPRIHAVHKLKSRQA